LETKRAEIAAETYHPLVLTRRSRKPTSHISLSGAFNGSSTGKLLTSNSALTASDTRTSWRL